MCLCAIKKVSYGEMSNQFQCGCKSTSNFSCFWHGCQNFACLFCSFIHGILLSLNHMALKWAFVLQLFFLLSFLYRISKVSPRALTQSRLRCCRGREIEREKKQLRSGQDGQISNTSVLMNFFTYALGWAPPSRRECRHANAIICHVATLTLVLAAWGQFSH